MPTSQSMLLILSLLVIWGKVNAYDENGFENNAEFEERKPDMTVENLIFSPGEDSDPTYLENFKDIWIAKNDPEWYFQRSTNRKRGALKRLHSYKGMNMLRGNFKDESIPGKPSLSIVSPLEALQRKVDDVFIANRNRGLLKEIGKRSVSNAEFFTQSDAPSALQSRSNELKKASCCQQLRRRKSYGLWRVPDRE